MFFIGGLGAPVYFEDFWMDARGTYDLRFDDSDRLVSERGLSGEDLERPVFVLVHGFSACSFAYAEMADFLEGEGQLVSRVIMGGHGRNLDVFRASSWEDWGQVILDEVLGLQRQGFSDIRLVAESAAGALVLRYLADGRLAGRLGVVLIDPFIVPRNRNLHLAPYLSFLVGNVRDVDEDDVQVMRYWHLNRPGATLVELNELVLGVQRDLRRGFDLDEGVRLQVFQADGDGTSDPAGMELIRSGVRGDVLIQVVDSDYHVFTHGATREGFGEADFALQQRVFGEVYRF